jgi:NADH-quinone oxidoreductase subunit H
MEQGRRIFHLATALVYAISLGLAVLTGVMAGGSVDASTLAFEQAQGADRWLVFHDPFNMVACLLYFVAAAVCCHRISIAWNQRSTPSPVRYGVALLLCALLAILWLGAWHDPFGFVLQLQEKALPSTGGIGSSLSAAAIGALLLAAKTFLLMYLQTFAHRVLPRLRADQVERIGLKVLLPLGCGNLLALAAYLWLIEPLADFQKSVQIVLAIVGLAGALVLVVYIACVRHALNHSAKI